MSVLDLFRLDGKVALVTGGSRGIGAAIATARAVQRTEREVDVIVVESVPVSAMPSHDGSSSNVWSSMPKRRA